MKNSIKSLLALVAFGAIASLVQAQPEPKILVVDIAQLYDKHYKTEEQNAKLRVDEQKAQEELEKLYKEGNSLVEKYKELQDQSTNPAATKEAQAKAQGDAQKMLDEINRKQRELNSFQTNTRNSIQQRIKTFQSLLVEEITKIAVDIAKRKGATLLIDKSGPSLLGFPVIAYSDPSYEITDDVAKEINKDRPAAPAVTAPTVAPTVAPAAPAASSDSSTKITVPGANPK